MDTTLSGLGGILERSRKEQTRLREEFKLGEKRINEEQKSLEDGRLDQTRQEEARRQRERWQTARRQYEEKRLEERRQESLKAEEAKRQEKGVTFTKDGKDYRLEEPGRVVNQDSGLEAYVRNAREVGTGELERNPDGRPREYLVDEKYKKVWEVNGTRNYQRDDYAKNPRRQRWTDNDGRMYEVVGERPLNARFNRPPWDKDPVFQTVSQEINKDAER